MNRRLRKKQHKVAEPIATDQEIILPAIDESQSFCNINTEAEKRFGIDRWAITQITLSFPVNVINGLRIYIKAFFEPAYGKYAVSPADTENIIEYLVEKCYLHPIKYNLSQEHKPWVLLEYGKPAVRDLYKSSLPTYGHYVDWDYYVLKVDKITDEYIDIYNSALDGYRMRYSEKKNLNIPSFKETSDEVVARLNSINERIAR